MKLPVYVTKQEVGRVCKALGIRGGLTMRIFGISERYGFRECTYLGLVPGGSQWDKVSGSELVGILAHAADYREKLRPKEKEELAEI